jgi:enoyl-CoA hydratase/carnithine racemase
MTTSEIQDGVHVLHLGDDANNVVEAFLDGVEGAVDAAVADPDAVGLVVTAAGKAFSQGYDLNHLGALGAGAGPFVQRSVDALAKVLVAPIPTAAAINGHAFGYGALLALACDVRVQRADRGWFCFPEVDLGLRFQPMQLALIRAKLSKASAEEAIITGKRYDGAASLAAGIVHATAAEGDELSTAVARLRERSGKGREILGGLKRDLFAEVLAVQAAPVPRG